MVFQKSEILKNVVSERWCTDSNLNGLLVTCQIGNTSLGGELEGNQSLVLRRDANLDTQSSDISPEEIRESGRSFQSLIVCGKKLLLYASLLADDMWFKSKVFY